MRALACALFVGTCLSVSSVVVAQDLGHRLIGTQGLQAGRQREPGLYFANQLAYYGAHTLRDRRGAEVPVEDLEVEALGNALGLSMVHAISGASTYVTLSVALPLAHTSVSSERPDVSLDRLGLGDVFVQPLLLGWRIPHLDVLAGYALYLPTGLFRLGRGGTSSGHTTHELSVGTTIYADAERRFFASAMASYHLNETKRGVDLRRGDTIQIQGGVGATLFGVLDVGVVGAALWQLRDDEGDALPTTLRGARDRVLGLGGEVAVVVAAIRGRVGVRYLRELDVRARTEGQIFVLQLAVLAPPPRAGE